MSGNPEFPDHCGAVVCGTAMLARMDRGAQRRPMHHGVRPLARKRRLHQGRPALATFRTAIYNFQEGSQISEHDALLGTKVAAILCGGDRAPGLASEQDFLDLEREAFLSLLGTRKTQERIQHMLKKGKPLRN